MLGFGILAPVLPLYARTFGVGYDEVGVLTSSFALTRLAFDLVAGRMVDRFEARDGLHRRVGVERVLSRTAALAPTFGWLVVFRAAGGAGFRPCSSPRSSRT